MGGKIIGYLCTIEGEPAGFDGQLHYATRRVEARVYRTREAAETATRRSARWRERRGFDVPDYDIVPLRKARS